MMTTQPRRATPAATPDADRPGRWARRLLGVLVAGGCCGCFQPSARFLKTDCVRGVDDDKQESLAFLSDIELNNLEGEQVVYRVGLLNAAGRPIRSSDGRYEDPSGQVCATKTYLAAGAPYTCEDARVTIPMDQLEVKAEDQPVAAEYSVALANGTRLADRLAMLPFKFVMTASGPSVEPAPVTAVATAERARGASPDRLAASGEKGARRTPPPRPVAALSPRESPPTPPPVPATARTDTGRRPAVTPAQASKPADARGAPRDAKGAPPQPTAPETRPPDAATNTGTPVPENVYVVAKGDSLFIIAERALGDRSRWTDILALNRDQLKGPYGLKEGMRLRLPPKSTPIREPVRRKN